MHDIYELSHRPESYSFQSQAAYPGASILASTRRVVFSTFAQESWASRPCFTPKLPGLATRAWARSTLLAKPRKRMAPSKNSATVMRPSPEETTLRLETQGKARHSTLPHTHQNTTSLNMLTTKAALSSLPSSIKWKRFTRS